MNTPLMAHRIRIAALVLALFALPACGASTATVAVVATATATATATPKPTAVPTATRTPAPTATATPAPGKCNPADFPTKTSGGPSGLQYPPLTYYYAQSPGAGNHPYVLCSPGTPATILSFMENSATKSGWKITSSTATSFAAEMPTNPPSGYCYTVNIQVGGSPGYPGEWTADFHPPAATCV